MLIFLSLVQYGFSQVDVVYNDLVWSDEFSNNGPVNNTNWFHQTQLPAGGSWFNGEVQHYTNQATNSFVNGGLLNIVARKEPFTDQGITKQYTSARLNSKFAFQYGRVEVRAKIPTQQGTWPAIWTLGRNINEDGAYFDSAFGNANWPACGEIDIMEHGIMPSQPLEYVQSALHTPSSFGNTTNIGGTTASGLGNNFHVYTMNWSPFQITFLLDGQPYYTYNPAVKNPANWPFDAPQYLLLNIAMGGIAGNIPSSFTQAAMEIDYVRVYQNTQVDTQPPLAFTANAGVVSNSSVELLLNGNDNSGSMVYQIVYNGGSLTVAHPSGSQKSVVISNLMPNTNYSFTVSASDMAGNAYATNPIVVNATTTGNQTCSGTSNVAQLGAFTTGYHYAFETTGTHVKITFELLDTDKTGVVAYLWQQNPFAETPMTQVSGNIFAHTLTGQTIGNTINYAVKFAYAGGMSVTQYFSYVVGSNCTLESDSFSAALPFSFLNPADGILVLQSDVDLDHVEIYNMMGARVLSSELNHNTIAIESLPNGIYWVGVRAGAWKGQQKKLVVHH